MVKKPYWKHVMAAREPFYLVPEGRYRFFPPEGFRKSKASGTQKKTSPWPTFWYCYAGKHHDVVRSWAYQTMRGANAPFKFARSKNALRDLRRVKKK